MIYWRNQQLVCQGITATGTSDHFSRLHFSIFGQSSIAATKQFAHVFVFTVIRRIVYQIQIMVFVHPFSVNSYQLINEKEKNFLLLYGPLHWHTTQCWIIQLGYIIHHADQQNSIPLRNIHYTKNTYLHHCRLIRANRRTIFTHIKRQQILCYWRLICVNIVRRFVCV